MQQKPSFMLIKVAFVTSEKPETICLNILLFIPITHANILPIHSLILTFSRVKFFLFIASLKFLIKKNSRDHSGLSARKYFGLPPLKTRAAKWLREEKKGNPTRETVIFHDETKEKCQVKPEKTSA